MKFSRNILLLLLFFYGKVYCQTVELPDDVFISFLKQNYPATINAENELIISEAELVKGAFNCSNQGISNLEGIQYFISINRLYASNNQLNNLPDISSIDGLITLHLADNLLTSLPNLNSLTQLEQLIAFNNQLNTFPDISALENLKEITLYTNAFSEVPAYDTFSGITMLNIGGNPVSDLSFLDKLDSIQSLNLWGLQISETPNLSDLVYLKELNLGTNYLTSAPDLSALKGLEILFLNNNLFTEIPKGLLELTQLKEVYLENNRFSFEDITPITSYPSYENVFNFFPQNQLEIVSSEEIRYNQEVKLLVNHNDSTKDLEYIWFKENDEILLSANPAFVINNFQKEDNGVYHCVVRSSSIPGFYLETQNLEVNGSDCINEALIDINQQQNCEDGNILEVFVNDYNISDYQLISSYDTVLSNSGYFSSLRNVDYQLLLKTQECTHKYSTSVFFSDLDCNEVLLTPDGDGINDSYYFEEQSLIEVFDKSGSKVASFMAPKRWSGEGTNGKLPSGYYYVSINGGKNIRMSIIY